MERTKRVAILDHGDFEVQPDPKILDYHVEVLKLPMAESDSTQTGGKEDFERDQKVYGFALNLVLGYHLQPMRTELIVPGGTVRSRGLGADHLIRQDSRLDPKLCK